jgi:hypothetical protein
LIFEFFRKDYKENKKYFIPVEWVGRANSVGEGRGLEDRIETSTMN